MKLKTFSLIFVTLWVAGVPAWGAELRSQTLAGFTQYVQLREAQMRASNDRGAFLRIDSLDPQQRERAYARLRSGEVLIERQPAAAVPDGLIHDWAGTVFMPGIVLPQALALLKDFSNYHKVYRPEVELSRLLEQKGDQYRAALRLREHKVLTVVLDTEYDIHFVQLNRTHASSHSYSTRIAEIENPGEKDEHALPPGNDQGFLWRIDTYWLLVEKDGGVYAQCEAISLTRDVPAGLGWMIGSYIESIPRESLLFTLNATRNALEHDKRQTGLNKSH